MAQVATVRQSSGDQGEPVGRGKQNPHIAVLKNEGHLLRFEQRINRHKHATGGWGAETCNDCLEALFEVDRHPLAALQSERHQTGRELVHAGSQLTVRQARGAAGQRPRLRRTVR